MLNLYYSQELSHSTDFRGSRVAPSWLLRGSRRFSRGKCVQMCEHYPIILHFYVRDIPNNKKTERFQRSVYGAGNRT